MSKKKIKVDNKEEVIEGLDKLCTESINELNRLSQQFVEIRRRIDKLKCVSQPKLNPLQLVVRSYMHEMFISALAQASDDKPVIEIPLVCITEDDIEYPPCKKLLDEYNIDTSELLFDAFKGDLLINFEELIKMCYVKHKGDTDNE